MIPCPTCGTDNPERARFCLGCGVALIRHDAAHRARDTRKLVTIVFIDAVGSTALAEILDPETIRTTMTGYFTMIRRIVEAHGGIVEKFIGDAVMAAFGIPVVHEDDAVRAVRAATEIQVVLRRLDEDDSARNGPTIRFRTGIDTGEVVAGDHTSGQSFATGDTVNSAARLQSAAPAGEILLGRSTWLLVRHAVAAEPVAPIEAKGKAQPIEAYRLKALDVTHGRDTPLAGRPLVGRAHELATLQAAFETVVAERACRLVTLLGAAGVGKSRLVASFVEGTAERATVLRGRCLSYGEGVTYWPIGEIVRSAAGIRESDDPAEAASKVVALLSTRQDAVTVASRVSSAIGLSEEVVPQAEAFWAIRSLLEELARARPLVVVIEDIHWAEPTLLELLRYIAGSIRDTPILMLCPARPELLDAHSDREAALDETTIVLEPLGATATRQLIAGLPGGAALPIAVTERLTSAAEGNPLFIEEFVGMLIDDGLLMEGPDGVWAATASVDAVRMPPSVKALISARLERLAPDERAVAERASVVGRAFEQAAVTELAGETLRPTVERSLHALVRKELVRRELDVLSAGEAFKFRHVLIRDAAYEALPKAERAILHERFADWLEATVGERLTEYKEIVGYHLEQAHRYRTELGETGEAVAALAVRAGTHLASAGVRASERGDLPSGIGLFTRAAALIPPGPRRIELLINMRSILRALGDREGADATDAEARALLEAYPDEGLEHHYRLTDASVDLEGSFDEAAKAFAYYERVGHAPGMMRALQLMSWDRAMKGRFTEAVAIMDKATALAIDLGRPDLAAGLVSSSAPTIVDSPLSVPEALERCQTYLDLVGEDRQARVMLLLAIGGLEAMSGVSDGWRATFDAAKAIIDDLGLVVPFGAALYPLNLADAEMLAGDPARVAGLLRESCATLDRLALPTLLASLAPVTAQVLLAVGQVDEVERYATWGRDLATSDDIDANARWRNALSALRRTEGRHVEAIELARESVAIMADSEFVDSQMTGQLVLARALRAAGDQAGALEAAEVARGLAATKGNVTALRTIAAFVGS
ncbi:MAG: ATP-binding protein [Chloroflexota bacterium]